MPFIKAKSGPPNIGNPQSKFTVQYFDEHGNMTIRSGGTRTWRCNNPGTLLKSSYSTSKDRRAIGTAGFGAYGRQIACHSRSHEKWKSLSTTRTWPT